MSVKMFASDITLYAFKLCLSRNYIADNILFFVEVLYLSFFILKLSKPKVIRMLTNKLVQLPLY